MFDAIRSFSLSLRPVFRSTLNFRRTCPMLVAIIVCAPCTNSLIRKQQKATHIIRVVPERVVELDRIVGSREFSRQHRWFFVMRQLYLSWGKSNCRHVLRQPAIARKGPRPRKFGIAGVSLSLWIHCHRSRRWRVPIRRAPACVEFAVPRRHACISGTIQPGQ